jgi:large subunit ribosomal protein L25
MKNTDKIELPVSPRMPGKHNSRVSRKGEKIPAVLYGPKSKPVNLLIDQILLQKYGGTKYESTIFSLKSDDKSLDKINVLLKDMQVHPLSRKPVHLDLYALDMSATVRVSIAIRFEGKAIGLTEGGMVQTTLRELEIECLPNDIPEFVVADVTNLHVGDTLHVYDLKLGDNIKIMSGAQLAVASVSIIEEEVVAPVVAAVAEGAVPAAGAAAAPGAAAAAAPAADKKK